MWKYSKPSFFLLIPQKLYSVVQDFVWPVHAEYICNIIFLLFHDVMKGRDKKKIARVWCYMHLYNISISSLLWNSTHLTNLEHLTFNWYHELVISIVCTYTYFLFENWICDAYNCWFIGSATPSKTVWE